MFKYSLAVACAVACAAEQSLPGLGVLVPVVPVLAQGMASVDVSGEEALPR